MANARLRRAEVRETLRLGQRHAGRWVILFARARPGGSRAGFVAGRRVGGSVERNRARRRLREAWRAVAADVDPGAAVVLVARRGILRATWPDLAADLRSVLTRFERVST